jgi:7-cyano-7-deazaguanine reductase
MAEETVLRGPAGEHYGHAVEYITTYRPSLLASVPRQHNRQTLGITPEALPFRGVDVWNAYEFTWLNARGRPEVALAQLQIPAQSLNIVESKSLKLYLGSYSGTRFGRRAEVINTLESDLTLAARGPVNVTLLSPEQVQQNGIGTLVGQSLDNLDIEMDEFFWNPDHLQIESSTIIRESLYTHLFKALCPMTGQPDFASILIQYKGQSIDNQGLLKYLLSYRDHPEFAEQVCERIFTDIMTRCDPERLTVQARFSRRGGIDINPFRSHEDILTSDVRVWRQ